MISYGCFTHGLHLDLYVSVREIPACSAGLRQGHVPCGSLRRWGTTWVGELFGCQLVYDDFLNLKISCFFWWVMCRVIWLVVFQMCFFDFTLWVGMSVFSWLTLKFIIIWHGVAQPRFVGIQIGSRVQGRAATTTCLMVDKVDSAKWGCWRILPTSDWLRFLGLFKIIVYWCLLFIFLWGCKLVAHPATPGPCWIHELLGLGTGCNRPRSRIHEIIGCTLPRGRSSTKTTSHAGETDNYHLDKMSGEVGNAAKQQNYIHVWVLRQFFADLRFKANILGGR